MVSERPLASEDTFLDDEYERVSACEVELVDLPADRDEPSLSPMAMEVEDTVIPLTRRLAPRLPARRPNVFSTASIAALSALLGAAATFVLSTGGAGYVPSARAVAAAQVKASAPPPPPVTLLAFSEAPPVVVPVAPLPEPVIATEAVAERPAPRVRTAHVAVQKDAGHEEGVAAPTSSNAPTPTESFDEAP